MTGLETTMVIPTYWGREQGNIQTDDLTYDHPTPLDAEGTLFRCLHSIGNLKHKDFTLVVIACATAPDIAEAVDDKVRKIISRAGLDLEVLLFGSTALSKMNKVVKTDTGEDYSDLINLAGYSPVRNMCLFAGHIRDSDITVFIDDDEVFEDTEFVAKTRKHIGTTVDGETVLAVAGYYLQPNGSYLLSPQPEPWMTAWNNAEMMNRGFRKIIGTPPRLKATPFVFGGNMVIHRSLGEAIPFDPSVPRGEDIDYLMNVRMFGHKFFLDNEMAIKHLPPPNTNPRWLQIRKDLYRFAFERAKIDSQEKFPDMTRIAAEDFDPYPGAFLKSDLEDRAKSASRLLAGQYEREGNEIDRKQALANITIADSGLIPEKNPFRSYCELKARWRKMMKRTSEAPLRSRLRQVLSRA